MNQVSNQLNREAQSSNEGYTLKELFDERVFRGNGYSYESFAETVMERMSQSSKELIRWLFSNRE